MSKLKIQYTNQVSGEYLGNLEVKEVFTRQDSTQERKDVYVVLPQNAKYLCNSVSSRHVFCYNLSKGTIHSYGGQTAIERVSCILRVGK